jgi:glyoxylase-like metal-dependent hydrolase (beta-lactamase superfamily II)
LKESMAKRPSMLVTETRWHGLATAAVLGPRGALCLDAPIQPLEADEWIAELHGKGAQRLAFVVQMDSSPERAVAVANLRALPQAGQLTLVAHQHTAEVMRTPPDSLRTGAVLATLGAGFQGGELALPPWVRPQVTFTERLTFHWDKTTVDLIHAPGVNPGALWVHVPQEKVLFVGDALTVDMPPYLGEADLPKWLEALARLRSAPGALSSAPAAAGCPGPGAVLRLPARVQHRLRLRSSRRRISRAAASWYLSASRDRRSMVEPARLFAGAEREHGPLSTGKAPEPLLPAVLRAPC